MEPIVAQVGDSCTGVGEVVADRSSMKLDLTAVVLEGLAELAAEDVVGFEQAELQIGVEE